MSLDPSYNMAMTFGKMSEPLTKVQNVDSSKTAQSYNFGYKYEDENHPTAPTQIGHDTYTYDANGNPTLVVNDSTNTTREMFGMRKPLGKGLASARDKTSRYTYNAAGERIVKSHGTMEGVYINGAPQGITSDCVDFRRRLGKSSELVCSRLALKFHETDEFTLYPASIMSVNKTRFTKHYFIGSQRVASKIGTGSFNNVYGINGSRVTAGQQDYAARMQQIESQKEEYYRKLGIAPGVPTMKGSYGDPENTGVGYNSVITELGDHSVPEGWVQTPKTNTTTGSAAGAPISWKDPTNPEDATAGYGYVADDTTDVEDIYYFHSDHLGSTSYVTDRKGNITQYDAYLPYGELLVDEHSSSEDMPYKFNGKEMDEETGLYYYGARYMNPVASIWYGVDQMTEKYEDESGYTYTHNNPVKFVDPNGQGSKGWNRFWGGMRAAGGSVQIAGGVAASWTGVGAVASIVAVVHGADDFQTGIRQLWTGEEKESLTFKGIKAGARQLGANENTSNAIATTSNIALSFVGSAGGTESLFKVFSKGNKFSEFTVAESKFDYFFGKVVAGNTHNVQRSRQISNALRTLGVKNKSQLVKLFAEANAKGEEVSRVTNKYGTTITKVINIGKKGQIRTGFFYEGGNLTKVPKVTTIIPKIFK